MRNEYFVGIISGQCARKNRQKCRRAKLLKAKLWQRRAGGAISLQPEIQAPSARHRCSLRRKPVQAPSRSGINGEKEYAAPMGLGILRASAGYKDSAPDGAEDALQTGLHEVQHFSKYDHRYSSFEKS
jgi:hypothetical protein